MAKKSFGGEAVGELAQGCGLLGNEMRLKIVWLLAQKEQNVDALCKIFKVSQPTMSHHLGLLRMGRLITGRRQGKQVIYSLNTLTLKNLKGELAKYVPAMVGCK